MNDIDRLEFAEFASAVRKIHSMVLALACALDGIRENGCEPAQFVPAMHGYRAGSKAIWEHLAGMDNQEAAHWIETTFSRFVADPVVAVEYVLGTAVQHP